jgi:hypothetical protein
VVRRAKVQRIGRITTVRRAKDRGWMVRVRLRRGPSRGHEGVRDGIRCVGECATFPSVSYRVITGER